MFVELIHKILNNFVNKAVFEIGIQVKNKINQSSYNFTKFIFFNYIAVRDYDAFMQKTELLKREQIIFRFDERPVQLLFVKGDFEQDTRTHHIHVVLHNSQEWSDYITLRDYLNTHDAAAERYAELKIELSKKYPNDRVAYTEGKSDLIAELLAEAAAWKSKG